MMQKRIFKKVLTVYDGPQFRQVVLLWFLIATDCIYALVRDDLVGKEWGG